MTEATTRDLLIEIGTEELPPKSLLGLSEAFSAAIAKGLEQRQLAYHRITPYATPRRLAVIVSAVATQQADREVERRGPAFAAAYDKTGQPTKAVMGFAKSCGVDVAALTKVETDKGTWLVHRSVQTGQATTTLIPTLVEEALAALPIPKRMRWSNLPFEFVRPVHWIVLLLGNEVIEATILGIRSGRETRGHRFHQPAPVVLNHPNDYVKTLTETGYVIPAFATRRDQIRQGVAQAAKDTGGIAVIEEALLDEVTSLVEWPVPVVGNFEEKFLQVPAEAIIATMKGNQKCFPVVDAAGKLLPRFIAVSNLQSLQPEVVRQGNERVIRPRLSDAAFFWHQDRAKTLESRLEQLKTVMFQNKLGSLYDKSKRVAKLSGQMAKLLGGEELQGVRAALLSKCDLVTNMVSEFPELQGIMGEYYARHDGEIEGVAVAVREQYLPRFAGDVLPTTVLGQALSIADKLDTLVGIFGINQPPTGDKDPFGLRRAAISVLRMTIESKLPLDVQQLLIEAQAAYPQNLMQADTSTQVFDFMLERLRSYYQDQGVGYDVVDAVLACRPTSPLDADHRIRGIVAFRDQPDFISLASANKRIHNILKKTEENFPASPEPAHFNEAAEKQLYDQVQTVMSHTGPLVKQGDYHSTLQHLATLRSTIDNFFDTVMVMVEDEAVRKNRLAFLQTVRSLFLQVADISRLQV